MKKNVSIRLVIDYRKLNQITVKDKYPVPTIYYLIQKTNGSRIFSQIGMNNGYCQIIMSDEDRHKTVFINNGKQYEFRRMPFGFSNAPSTFQRAIKHIFFDYDQFEVFLDDILIHIPDNNTHVKHVYKFYKPA